MTVIGNIGAIIKKAQTPPNITKRMTLGANGEVMSPAEARQKTIEMFSTRTEQGRINSLKLNRALSHRHPLDEQQATFMKFNLEEYLITALGKTPQKAQELAERAKNKYINVTA